MSTRSSVSGGRLVSGRSRVRSPDAAPGQGLFAALAGVAQTAIATAIRPRKRPETLRGQLRAALLTTMKGMFVVGCFFAAFALVKPAAPAAQPYMTSPEDQAAAVVASLIEEHGCWTGDAPKRYAGQIPGHAVVTLPGAAAEVVDSQVGFDVWLGPDGQAGSGDETRGAVHAFCP